MHREICLLFKEQISSNFNHQEKKSQTFVKENKSPGRLIVRKSPYYFIKRKKTWNKLIISPSPEFSLLIIYTALRALTTIPYYSSYLCKCVVFPTNLKDLCWQICVQLILIFTKPVSSFVFCKELFLPPLKPCEGWGKLKVMRKRLFDLRRFSTTAYHLPHTFVAGIFSYIPNCTS